MNNVESTCEQQGFEILHSVANRVRLRALDTKTKDKLTEIAQHLRKQAGIQTVRINQDTGSLVITYNQNIVSRAQVQQLLEPFSVIQETTAPELGGSDSYNQTLKRLSSFIPPVVGIAAVRGLGVAGWQGLAAYMVTSRVTRGVMNQFDLSLPRLPEKKSQAVKEQGKQTHLAIEATQSRKPTQSEYQVIHQIPGRIRLSIPRVKQDLDYVKNLENLAQWDNRITSVRVNRETASVVIHYRTGTPSNTGKMPLTSSELIALLELVASEKIDSPNQPKNQDKVDSQTVIPQSLEELSTDTEDPDVHKNEYVKQPEVQEKLEPEAVVESKETETSNPIQSEPILEEENRTDQSASEVENEQKEEEQSLSLINEQPEDSSPEQRINPIGSAEQDYKRFELSEEEESENPWRRFKACMLTTMLRLMANFPLQQA